MYRLTIIRNEQITTILGFEQTDLVEESDLQIVLKMLPAENIECIKTNDKVIIDHASESIYVEKSDDQEIDFHKVILIDDQK